MLHLNNLKWNLYSTEQYMTFCSPTRLTTGILVCVLKLYICALLSALYFTSNLCSIPPSACREVRPPEGRGAQAVDSGCDRQKNGGQLHGEPEGWSPVVRVSGQTLTGDVMFMLIGL